MLDHVQQKAHKNFFRQQQDIFSEWDPKLIELCQQVSSMPETLDSPTPSKGGKSEPFRP